ncbi:D-alanyl-D-alanine carboxypeptidase [Lacrimispora sp. NSJ-141]|uniref:D-alanyl-D-alanine carboxypeptidase n=1 Tax=Lientehia hominis TaxID=2897778 RepID=A0AAP2W686_9FIRM|nr:D-alanyl-D-alanine carboxypeptidase family protein [Lientehia hominis]MCD2491053.1 D-alanyl-D-alanine carboxypeptidase [Lientehia hominis]
MPRTTTAKQVKRTRIALKFGLAILAVAACTIVFSCFIKSPFSGKGSTSMLAAYEGQDEDLSMEAPDVPGEAPALFAEKLCVVTADSEADPDITSEAGVTFDRTNGEVVYSKNAYERLYPASVTKIMTCLVALKYGDLSKEITVRADMLANLDPDSSVCRVKDGDTLNLEQLLYGLMLPSGNDAANVIAYLVAGGEEAFVELMNQEARSLGATDSHFVNAHGLNDPNHYTTAYDIYLIFNELMNYEEFMKIIGTQQYTAQYTNNGQPVTNTWNRGIWYFCGQAVAPDGVTPLGGKTGTTPEAKFCLSMASEDETGAQYVSVVLKADSRESLYVTMTSLLSKIQK